MFKPAFLFIGLRYTRAKSRHQFISFISLISILGIALGVTILITVLSVINGFDKEIKKQIFDMIAPITINSYSHKINHWQMVEKEIKSLPGVIGVAPYISNQAMFTNLGSTVPVMLIGILPEQETKVSALNQKMVSGKLNDLNTKQPGIIIGSVLAQQLNLHIGDAITVATLKKSATLSQVMPIFKKFNVVGIFKAGGGALNFDARMTFIHLHTAQQINQSLHAVSGFHININDIYQATTLRYDLQNKLSTHLQIWDWTEELGDFFDNIRLTKTIMFLIFVLIIAVAAFNLICTMVMVVKNKQSDIAILRTLGATPATILCIFMVQGISVALIGTFIGIISGLALTCHITAISTAIQHVLHTELISSNIYFINYLPSELLWTDVGKISLVALILSLIATLYPAWNASRIEPVEILKLE